MDNAGGPSRADQLDLMLTYEQHAHARTKAERDAARAEVAQLQQKLHEAEERAIGDDATFKRLISERTVADQQRDAALSERWKLNAEVAQAPAERDEARHQASELSTDKQELLDEAEATIATLRAELQAAQELYEIGDTCVETAMTLLRSEFESLKRQARHAK